MSSRLGLRDWAFALAAFAPPGISKEQFPESGGQRYMMVDREAIILKTTLPAPPGGSAICSASGLTLEWISVPRLDYSLVINGNPARAGRSPVSSMLGYPGADDRLRWFTFNAIVGAWFRPRRGCSSGLPGRSCPAKIVTHSTLDAHRPRVGVASDRSPRSATATPPTT